jgi:hypothetical protein
MVIGLNGEVLYKSLGTMDAGDSAHASAKLPSDE